jgi:hypothetical protein
MEPEASNLEHQHLVKKATNNKNKCDECGYQIVSRFKCEVCNGEDDAGDRFCPVCDYCCGC